MQILTQYELDQCITMANKRNIFNESINKNIFINIFIIKTYLDACYGVMCIKII